MRRPQSIAATFGTGVGTPTPWNKDSYAYDGAGILNGNRFLRMGYGRKGGEKVFRLAGELVKRIVEGVHVDIWRIGPL